MIWHQNVHYQCHSRRWNKIGLYEIYFLNEKINYEIMRDFITWNKPSKIGDRRQWVTLRHYYSFTLISEYSFGTCFYSWNQSTLHIKSNVCFVYWVLVCFVFVFFIDMHYNTMIRMFCILKKMAFSAFHYLTLSIRCEELDTHIK